MLTDAVDVVLRMQLLLFFQINSHLYTVFDTETVNVTLVPLCPIIMDDF